MAGDEPIIPTADSGDNSGPSTGEEAIVVTRNSKGQFEAGNAFAWKKGGPSPNPGGRKRKPFTDKLHEYFDKRMPTEIRTQLNAAAHINLPPKTTWGDVIILGALRKAAEGDAPVLKELIGRLDGALDQADESGPRDRLDEFLSALRVVEGGD